MLDFPSFLCYTRVVYTALMNTHGNRLVITPTFRLLTAHRQSQKSPVFHVNHYGGNRINLEYKILYSRFQENTQNLLELTRTY